MSHLPDTFRAAKSARGIQFYIAEKPASQIPIVLVMGYAGSSRAWPTSFLKELSERCSLVVLDNRGTGLSPKPKEVSAYQIPELALDLHSVLKCIDASKFHLVGYSLGGCISLEMAAAHPELVASLTLVSSTAGSRAYHPPADGILARLENPVGNTLEELNRSTWECCLSKDKVDQHWLALMETMEVERERLTPRFALRGQLDAYKKFDRSKAVQFPFSTLIISGDSDPLTPLENSLELHRIILGSKICIIRDCQHMPHIEKAEEFLMLISNFVLGKDPAK